MIAITVQITDQQAREWKATLADWIQRQTGKPARADVTLDDLVRVALFRIVAGEAGQQAVDALAKME